MYCINCGVKLADTEKQCPLCGVQVFHPELTRPEAQSLYPRDKYPVEKLRSRIPHIIWSMILLLPIMTVLLCDLQMNGTVTWAGYVIGAILLGYVVLVLPLWFHRPNPVIFVPCDFAAVTLYLLYINCKVGGHWFLSFSFPITGGVGLIVTTVVVLLRYVPRGKFYIFGGASIALGAFMLLLEFLMNLTFGFPRFLGWSLYPLTALVLLGGMLIFLGICRPAREIVERKIFL